MPRIGITFWAVALIFLAGCSKDEPVAFTDWTPSPSGSAESAAMAKLKEAGSMIVAQATAKAGKDSKGRPNTPITSRTNFFPQQRKQAMQIVAPYRQTILNSVSQPLAFSYDPPGLEKPPEYLDGIKMVGLIELWKIEDAISARNPALALPACINATKIGYALMGGGGYEAALGANLINQARTKTLEVIRFFDAIQLGKLAVGIQKASANRPSSIIAVRHERDNMLLTLSGLQKGVSGAGFDGWVKGTFGDSSDALRELLGVLRKKPERAKELFDWLGGDIKKRSAWFESKLKNPKLADAPPKIEKNSSHQLLYLYFGSNLDSLVPLIQSTYCRTQLFVLDCYLRQRQKARKPLPKSLSEFSKAATIDPFTKEPFFYDGGGTTYKLYSAGEDGVDNGGASDASYRAPDMLLEEAQS